VAAELPQTAHAAPTSRGRRHWVARVVPLVLLAGGAIGLALTPPLLGHEFLVAEADLPDLEPDWSLVEETGTEETGTIGINSSAGMLEQPLFRYRHTDGMECEMILAVCRYQGSNVFRRFMAAYESRGYLIKLSRSASFDVDLHQGKSLRTSWIELTDEENAPALSVHWYMTHEDIASSFASMWIERILDRIRGRQPHWAVVYLLFTWPDERVVNEEAVAPMVAAVAESLDAVLADAESR
jgi:hypothetical protein